MPEGEKKNGSGNGREATIETGMKRDGKGRFLPGNPGPGRGNSKQREVIQSIKELLENDDMSLLDSKVLDLIGRLLLNDAISKDKKTRSDATKQYLNWLSKRIEAEARERERENIAKPEEIERIRECIKLRMELDIFGDKEISDLLCFRCKKKLGINDEGLRENDQC